MFSNAQRQRGGSSSVRWSVGGEPNRRFGKIDVETRERHEVFKGRIDGFDGFFVNFSEEEDIIRIKKVGKLDVFNLHRRPFVGSNIFVDDLS